MLEEIRQLRGETGAPLGVIRAALLESGADLGKARLLLQEKYGAAADKKSSREVHSGVVDAYVHANGRIASLIELQSETDFVARNPEFRRLAHDIAMHIAAMAPQDVGELEAQEYVKEPTRTIRDIVNEAIGKFGENIRIGRFTRFEL